MGSTLDSDGIRDERFWQYEKLSGSKSLPASQGPPEHPRCAGKEDLMFGWPFCWSCIRPFHLPGGANRLRFRAGRLRAKRDAREDGDYGKSLFVPYTGPEKYKADFGLVSRR
ncbi:MAG: hypothetical protein M1821_008959 [Bathelium mastoideum]|nr:MAG: hypothetical protein M1821_008959 [Bathelium mastoideum]